MKFEDINEGDLIVAENFIIAYEMNNDIATKSDEYTPTFEIPPDTPMLVLNKKSINNNDYKNDIFESLKFGDIPYVYIFDVIVFKTKAKISLNTLSVIHKMQ